MSTPSSTAAPFWQKALLTIGAAVLANVVTRFIVGLAILAIPSNFDPLRYASIIAFTVLGAVGAVVAYWLIQRVSSNPNRTFTIVAVVALVLSILPNFGLMANPAAAPMPNGTPLGYGVLILFHVVAGVVCIYMLTRR
jgi:uncharacterized membrane protein YeaQ/YmgE (transglycosylase-associated protein family)